MKTWLITGTSRGFGREWAIAALDRGDKVAATARERALVSRRSRVAKPGEPSATRQAILTLVDSENPPLRLFLGELPLQIATADYDARLASWREWQPVAVAAQGHQG
ncbi:MAG TPA: hypothetical protein VHZ33_39855 [Trebonia sp.]|nr:hypothetical protein [Trebonia sp.]